jgi:hypothetical protein
MSSHAEKILFSYNWTTSIEAELKVKAYGKLSLFAEKNPITVRVLSPFIGVTAGLVSVARQIIQIAESALLLLASVFAGLAQVKGVNPLFSLGVFVIVTPIDILKLPFTVIYAAFESVGVTFNIALAGKNGCLVSKRQIPELLKGSLDQRCYKEHRELYPQFFTIEESMIGQPTPVIEILNQ